MAVTQTKEKVELRVFMTSVRANYDAIGIFDGKGITILKNSIVSPTVTHNRLDTDKRAALLTPGGALKEDTYLKTLIKLSLTLFSYLHFNLNFYSFQYRIVQLF